ncbi:BolA/IbaG family iron-sulfur metabolism protein [Salinisphaera sp. T31B1]|uniref:BolA family protein n=1 Tax=Salinisphaera sp. T31B1 TaxID=727963 RepID=UPI0033414730
MYSADAIRELIQDGLPDARVEVMGDDGQHFAARVISASFVGKGIVEQHRMVYATLGERMGGEIHALSLKTMTPEQAGLV